MQRKDKLAKLLEKSSVPQPINYEILEKVKRNIDWDAITNDGRIKNLWQNKILLTIVASIILVLAIIGITLGVVLPRQSNTPLLPDIKFYHYNEEYTELHNSIDEYIAIKDVQFEYFDNLFNAKEKIKIYLDGEEDILINQHITFSETLETIILYVELKNNYIFDFLDKYDKLEDKVKLNETEVDFSTIYNESTYSYITHARFKYKDKVYRVSFDLIEEDGWKTYLQQLIK